jgi:O-antigen/teichoic acid export membrane protein
VRERTSHLAFDSATSGAPALRSSAGLLVAATVASGVLNYAYTLVLTRLLPTRSFSAFSSSLAILLVVGTVANAAVPWILAKELRGTGSGLASRRAVSAGLVLNVLLGLSAAVVCTLLASRFLGKWSLFALAIGAFGFFVASTGMGWALGRGRYGLLAVMVAGEVGVKALVGILWVSNGGGLNAAIAATAFGALLVIVVSVFALGDDRQLVRPGRHFGRILKTSAGLSILQGVLVAAAVLDVVSIEFILPSTPRVAAYQLAATLGRAPIFLAMAVTAVVFPAIVGDTDHRSEDGTRVFEGQRLLLNLILPAWSILATVPRSVILLIAPSSYAGALHFLPVTAASGLLWTLVIFLSCCLGAAGRIRIAATSLISCGVLGLLAMAIAGRDLGVWGFAVIELLTALVTLVVVATWSGRQWGRECFSGVAKSFIWVLPVIPLALLHELPIFWVLGAAITGILKTIDDLGRAGEVVEIGK